MYPNTMTARPAARWCAALVLTLLAFPPGRVAAQKASDSATVRPKALGAIVISATRTEQEIRTLPSHVLVIDRPAIAASSAQTVQDLLRRIPGFTTRDFQSGLVSGPSQSMVSFRGLGGSSAGRALVLLDGLPAGDPFSGWLDWGRIPMPMLESAEVVRGGGSVVWGSRSLAGVVNLRTISPRQDEVRLVVESGSLGTRRVAGTASFRREKLGGTIGAEGWKTDGFVVLRQAGAADEPDERENRTVSAKLTWDPSQSLQMWLGGNSFTGGDPPIGTDSRQYFGEGRGGLRWLTERGVLSLSTFTNQRSAVVQTNNYNTDRSVKTIGRSTGSPAQSTGMTLQWTQTFFGAHELTGGADLSKASGSVIESFNMVNELPTRERAVSGEQQLGGVFFQDAADLGHGVRMVASVRSDRVSNSGGRRVLRDLETDAVLTDSALGGKTTTESTYSLGLRWQQSGWLGWRGSVYEGFRAPSMYEMYQPRYSNRGAITESNAQLDAERLKGAEVGADLTLATGVVARITAFTNRVSSPIMDVTIGTAGAQAQVIAPCGLVPARQTCGQRQNLPELRSKGIETEVTWQPDVLWDLSAGYAFSPTKVEAPGHPADGMQAIRSARHMITAGVTFSPSWVTFGVDGKYVGPRFDDDLNTVELADFYLIGLRVNKPLTHTLTTYLKIENLLDEVFEVARTRAGLADMGAPRWISVGMRAAW